VSVHLKGLIQSNYSQTEKGEPTHQPSKVMLKTQTPAGRDHHQKIGGLSSRTEYH